MEFASYTGSMTGCKDIFALLGGIKEKKLVENSRQDFGQRMKEAALGFLCYKLSIVMWSVGGGAESKLSDYINGQVDHTGSIRHISFPAGAS